MYFLFSVYVYLTPLALQEGLLPLVVLINLSNKHFSSSSWNYAPVTSTHCPPHQKNICWLNDDLFLCHFYCSPIDYFLGSFAIVRVSSPFYTAKVEVMWQNCKPSWGGGQGGWLRQQQTTVNVGFPWRFAFDFATLTMTTILPWLWPCCLNVTKL